MQNLTDDVFQINVGADGEFADAVAVGVSVGIFPEVTLKLAVLRMGLGEPVSAHADGERIVLEIAELGTEIISDYAVNHECSVHLSRRGKDFSAG